MSISINPISFNPKVYSLHNSNLPIAPSNQAFTGYRRQISDITIQPYFLVIEKSLIANDSTRLGANYNKKTGDVEFKLASKNASKVFLCVFDNPDTNTPKAVISMQKGDDNIWQAKMKANPKEPLYYGYRVFGPNWQYSDDFFNEDGTIKNPEAGFVSVVDEKGNRFNPNKLAFDPYSKELSHIPSLNKAGSQAVYFSSENIFSDNASFAPKSVFVQQDDLKITKTSSRPLTKEIIGEVHLKDLTMNEDVEGSGTYVGAKNMVKKLKDTGITMVEFLPLNEFDDIDAYGNHWGYMPLGYFSLAKKYAQDKTPGAMMKEFREMIDAFHKEDIKVCMDVVFNHTGEGCTRNNDPNDAKQLSYALIDNQMYYKQKDGRYNSNSGCGNDLNTSDDEVKNLVADSIAFWAKQGVDAFRFDLAAALLDNGEENNVYYDYENSLAVKLPELLAQRGIKVNMPNESGDGIYLIAEPWTCSGDYSYQIGNFSDNWAEWNDVARETIKKEGMFPDSVKPKDLRRILEGSPDILGSADKSVNYAYSHDGYNLRDANTTTPKEGSWHFAKDYDGDKHKQMLSMKKQIALTLLLKGTPMLQVGDIIAHTKKGEDNPYNLDNDVNYLDFSPIEDKGSLEEMVYDFSTKMIQFRKDHPCISDTRSNIEYYDIFANKIPDNDHDYWNSGNSKMFCYKQGRNNPIFVSISDSDYMENVILPPNSYGKKWKLACDTNRDYSFVSDGDIRIEEYYQHPKSVIIFEEVYDDD